MTIAELLVATIILLLVAGGMTLVISLGSKHLSESVRNSEAAELGSTINAILTNEIGYANTVWIDDENKVTGFLSQNYQDPQYRNSLTTDAGGDYGHLIFKFKEAGTGSNWEVVGEKSYPHGLLAKVDTFLYDPDTAVYTLAVSIGYKGSEIVRREFSILAVNEPTVERE